MSNLSQAGNQYRRIKAKCLPMFELAAGKDIGDQVSIYRTMVLQIGATLGVDVDRRDLYVPMPDLEVEIAPDVSGLMDALDRINTQRFFTPRPKYSPGGRVQPPQFIDPTRPPFARYDYGIPA